jgi:hypothetical protein
MIWDVIYAVKLRVTFCNFRKGALIFKEALAEQYITQLAGPN